MQAGINTNVLKNFILKQVGDSMTKNEARELGMEKEFKAAATELDVTELDLNDVIKDNDLYEQFATMYVEERDNKGAAKDKEAEKQEQRQVKDKNGAGV